MFFTDEHTSMVTLMMSVMGSFDEFKQALILERQREGIPTAKARDAHKGRKPALATAQAAQLCAQAAASESKADLAREFGISRETVYAHLRRQTPA